MYCDAGSSMLAFSHDRQGGPAMTSFEAASSFKTVADRCRTVEAWPDDDAAHNHAAALESVPWHR